VAGALTERDFVAKLEKAGFLDIEILERSPVGVDDLALYPLFTPDLLELMRRLIPAERQGAVAVAVVVRARRAGPSLATN
jgi:arsenite methyltransferase